MSRRPGRAGRKLGRHGFADHNAARCTRGDDSGRVGSRPPALPDRRAVFGGHVGGIEDVLDADGQAVEQPRAGCRAAHVRGIDKRERAHIAFAVADALPGHASSRSVGASRPVRMR